MPILNAPPAQTKNETIQLRVSHETKLRLAHYAEFIHATTSYVVVEALNRIFDKDRDFRAWLQQQTDKVFHDDNKTKHVTKMSEEPRNAT